jgi:putative ABC transport system permease protein
VVCLLNAAGLMLAKYMSRSASVGVRRALGADRPAIFAQGLVEAGMLGLVGGLIGVGLIQLGLIGSRAELPQDLAVLTHMRAGDFFIAVSLAIVTALLAGLYPAWRAMQVEPALQIKSE